MGIALARLPLWLEGRRRYQLRRQLQMQEDTRE
jgi:hypothetical protein